MDSSTPKPPAAGDGATGIPSAPATADASSAPPSKAEAAVAADLERTPAGPSAGTEPAAQAVAAATPRPSAPPLPSSYEMPDDYADESWFDKTKAWVEENPALAVLAAAGVGLVVGRFVIGLAPEPEPPSLSDRIEKRAREIAKETKKGGRRAAKNARGLVHDTSGSVSDGLHRAADALRDAAGSVAERTEHGVDRTLDVADSVADAIKVALAGVAAKAADEWVARVKR